MIAAQTSAELPSHHLAGNTMWNLLGYFVPMVVAVVAIPRLLDGLGVARFGVLSLAWIVTGYFGFFDFGIGRALTKMVADKVGSHDEDAMAALVWTALLLLLALGVFGALAMLALSAWFIHRVLHMPTMLQAETLHGFYLMALCIPCVTLTSGLRGVLEGMQLFRIANLLRIPISVFSLVGPLMVLPFTRSLLWVMAVLTLGRLAGCGAFFIACLQACPVLRDHIIFEPGLVKPVVVFGGWMTVSNVISPIMIYVDRFVLGAIVPVGVVAYYTAPFDMVTRFMVIPGAVAGVLFPAFALNLVKDPRRALQLLNRSLDYLFAIMLPIALCLIAFAPEILRLWLGASFAENGSAVLRWLAAGVFINSLAQVPFALVQSAGRPDITAKMHMFELPIYLVSVWLLTQKLGIQGTAIAWSGRLALDTLLIAYAVQRVVAPDGRYPVKMAFWPWRVQPFFMLERCNRV